MSKIEECDAVVVCGYIQDSPWKDNRYGCCDECGVPIQWRPHSEHMEFDKVARLCPKCGLSGMLAAMENGEEIEPIITSETAKEINQLHGINLKPTEGH